jgi:epoxide hydrolase-like predicted phosphatase
MRSEPVSERTIEAALFDFGGVLTTPVWDTFADFCRREGLEPDLVKRVFREDPEALALLRRLEIGELSEDEFEAEFGRRLGLEHPENLIDSLFAGMKPDDTMISAVRDLRVGGIKTGLISNSWSTGHYDRELLGLIFDESLISGELGMHKPEPEIYLLAAKRLEVDPSACVFVDDLRENCEGAEAVGMLPLRHRNPAETISKLAELTGVALD